MADALRFCQECEWASASDCYPDLGYSWAWTSPEALDRPVLSRVKCVTLRNRDPLDFMTLNTDVRRRWTPEVSEIQTDITIKTLLRL